MVRSSNRRAALPAGPAPELAPGGAAAPEEAAWEEEATAALVAGFSDAGPEVEAWMEGEADTAADSILLFYHRYRCRLTMHDVY